MILCNSLGNTTTETVSSGSHAMSHLHMATAHNVGRGSGAGLTTSCWTGAIHGTAHAGSSSRLAGGLRKAQEGF